MLASRDPTCQRSHYERLMAKGEIVDPESWMALLSNVARHEDVMCGEKYGSHRLACEEIGTNMP